MFLYADVKSERASKGQGGNEYLDIAIKVIDKIKAVLNLRIELLKDGYYWIKLTDCKNDKTLYAKKTKIKQ